MQPIAPCADCWNSAAITCSKSFSPSSSVFFSFLLWHLRHLASGPAAACSARPAAGAIPGGDLQSIDEVRWREAWDLKVFGYINMTRAFLDAMEQRGSGVIINVTGLAADRTDAGYVAGTAGNAGLNAFTRAVGGRSLSHGVRVLAVSPGPVATDRSPVGRARGARW